MSSEEKPPGGEKPVVCDHDWLFGTLIQWHPCQHDILELTLSDEQFGLINAEQAVLVSGSLRSSELRRRTADAVIKVPRADALGKLAVRFLLEHKSNIDEQALMIQLLRYQVALYEQENTPVTTVVINNGVPVGTGGVLRFRDWLEQSDEVFWRAYGDRVMNFSAVVLNLRDARVQRRLVESDRHSALGWYVMGRVSDEIDRALVQEMSLMSSKFDSAAVDRVLVPVLGYLQHYHSEFTISLLEEFGLQASEESKVMVETLNAWELPNRLGRQEGRQEGLKEGRRQGGIESRQEIAQRLLHDGVDLELISKYTELSVSQIQQLANGGGKPN